MPSVKRRHLIALLIFCLLFGALAVLSELWLLRETEGRIADDFGIYYQAYLRARAGENPYVPYKIGLSFIYHPFALTWTSLFDWNGVRLAAILWMAAGTLAWIGSLLVSLRLLARQGAELGQPPMPRAWTWLAALLLLAFAPMGESIHVGQINGFVVLCLVLTYYGSEREGLGWEIVASVALGLAVVLKTSPIVLMLYMAALRRYRLILFSMLSVVALSIIPAIQFRPHLVFQFADTVLRIGSGIHYSTYNQSLLRIVWQALRVVGVTGVDGPLVRLFQVASGLLFAISSGAAWLTRGGSRPARLALYNLLLGLMVVASPIVWYHHNTLLLLPVLTLLLHQERRIRWTGLLALLLMQSERALEAAGLLSGFATGLAAVAGQMIVLLAFIALCGRDRWPALKARLAQGAASWQRYSGDV